MPAQQGPHRLKAVGPRFAICSFSSGQILQESGTSYQVHDYSVVHFPSCYTVGVFELLQKIKALFGDAQRGTRSPSVSPVRGFLLSVRSVWSGFRCYSINIADCILLGFHF